MNIKMYGYTYVQQKDIKKYVLKDEQKGAKKYVQKYVQNNIKKHVYSRKV